LLEDIKNNPEKYKDNKKWFSSFNNLINCSKYFY
jgi:hypothetical protein